jgi:signal transduction histidine kinase/ligand-binding sensor domain-containing protein/DNA-binding response OmpR family regulator
MRSALVTIWILLVGFNSWAQEYRFTSSLINMYDGLPDNNVNCIIQDHQGLMWFGTRNGLCSYDGFHLEIFKNEDGLGVSHSYIRSLYETENRFLWIGTYGGGLNLYDLHTEQFKHFPYLNSDSIMVESNALDSELPEKIYSIVSRKKGELWIGTQMGLYRVEYVVNGELTIQNIKRYRASNSNPNSLVDNKIFKLMFDRKGKLWISSNEGGLSILDPDTELFENFRAGDGPNDLPGNQVMLTLEDSRGRIWVGTWENGLALYRPESKDFLCYRAGPEKDNLSGNNVFKMCEDQEGQLWIGATYFGLDRLDLTLYDRDETRFIHHWTQDGTDNLVNSNVILSLFASKDGTVWISSQGLGVYRISSSKNFFKRYTKEDGKKSLSGNDITAIVGDSSNNLWIGTWEEGLNLARIEDNKLEVLEYFRRSSPRHPISSDSVYALLPDTENNIWVGSWGGLDKITPQSSGTYKTEAIPLIMEGVQIYKYNVNTLYLDENQRLWTGTEDLGLFYLDREEPAIRPIQEMQGYSSNTSVLNIASIHCIYSCPSLIPGVESELWVGCRGGLNRILFREDQLIIKHYNATQQYGGLPDDDIKNFTRIADELWIGTAQGMAVFDLEKNQFKNEHLFQGEYMISALHDSDNSLWISTIASLINYRIDEGIKKDFIEASYGVTHGFNHNASFRGPDGRFYFGSNRGMIAFNFRNLEYAFQPEVQFTDLKVNTNTIKPLNRKKGKSILDKSIRFTSAITLKHAENSFTVEFSSDSYNEPENNRFSYRLNGFQDQWTEVPLERAFATFSKLPQGRYKLEVRANNKDGVWSQEPARLQIHILPPPWKTWWAYLIYLALILGALLFFRILIIRRIRLQEAIRFEKYKREKEEELNQQRLQFFTNISHELRTPLTLIHGPLEQIAGKLPKDTELQYSLGLIRNNTTKLLTLINQLLDFRRIEMGKEKLAASEIKLVAISHKIFNDFMLMAQEEDIEFEFTSETKELRAWAEEDKYDKILVNLLSNALKYTPRGGRVELQIKKKLLPDHDNDTFDVSFGKLKDNQCVEISVIDNGPGIPKNEIEEIFEQFYRIKNQEERIKKARQVQGTGIGLALVKQLVLIHHGQLGISSKPGHGSTFVVRLPVGKDYLEQDELAVSVQDPPKTPDKEVILPVYRGTSDKKILVVEDNSEMREFILSILRPYYAVLEAENGKTGVSFAREKDPDLIISDVMMPEMNGMDLCRMIKSDLETSHIPFILLTARSSLENNIEGLEAGADDYISKPFSPEVLMLRIKNRFESRDKLAERFQKDLKFSHLDISNSHTDDEFMTRLLDFIDQNLDNENLDVNRFVDEFGMSRSTFNRKLKQMTRQGPAEFLVTYRLKIAASLLCKASSSIKEVAFRVGFSDSRYFATRFKRQFGKTPTQFQEENS